MIKTQACPRCAGAVLEYSGANVDGPLCVNCGWRPAEIPPDVQEQVMAHMGKPYAEERYLHSQIGTGKAPLNGWQRTKRRRERRAVGANRQSAIA